MEEKHGRIGLDAAWVGKVLAQARQSQEQTKRNYSSTEARYSSQEGMHFTAGGIKSTWEAIGAATAPAPLAVPTAAPAPLTVPAAAPVPPAAPVATPSPPVVPAAAPAPVLGTVEQQIEMMRLQMAIKEADAAKEREKKEQLQLQQNAGLPRASAGPAKIVKKCESTVESRGGAGKRDRSDTKATVGVPEKKKKKKRAKEVDPDDLALATQMREYMIEMRTNTVVANVKLAEKGEKSKKGS